MAGEVQFHYRTSGSLFLGYVIFSVNSGGLAFNTPAETWDVYDSLPFSSFFNSFQGGMLQGGNYYVADFPQAIVAGSYNLLAIDLLLGGYLNPGQGTGQIQWAGTLSGSRVVTSYSMLSTSGLFANSFPTQLSRSYAVRNFPIYLKSSEDHYTPFTGGIVSGQIARDSGLFTALQSGQITEVGHGFYNVMGLTSGDLDAGTAKMLFIARGVSGGWSDPLAYSLVLQRNANSGS